MSYAEKSKDGMSAEILGRNLLAEVKEESLNELLHPFRAFKPPPDRYQIGVAALDRIIDIFFHRPNPQRQQALPGSHWSPAAQPALRQESACAETRAPVVELTGATPSSGKTQLLHHIIAATVLPKAYNGTSIGGKEAAVALFDLSSSYSVLRLGTILEARISEAFLASDSNVHLYETLVHESLQHLHVFRPQSHESFINTVAALSTYFLSDTTSHYSANRPIGAIIIHNLSAFFWQDRQDVEDQKDAALEEPDIQVPDRENSLFLSRYRSLVSILRRAQMLFDCPIIATDWALATPVYSGDGSSLRPHLPGIWTSFRTVNVVLQRNSVKKFGPGMSVEEVLAEREQRQEAVDRTGFRGLVNWWDSEGWKEEVRIAVRAWGKQGGLIYSISEQGVAFEIMG